MPIIVAFGLWSARTSRRRLSRILVVAAAASFLAALGSHLHVAGVQTIALPYQLLRNLPIFRLITPSRLFVYTALAVAVGVAAWVAEAPSGSTRRRRRWLLLALGAVMVAPNIGTRLWGATPSDPPFFATGMYRSYLQPDKVLLAFPFGVDENSMLWQAQTGFYFRMPEGYLGHYAPAQFAAQPVIDAFGANQPTRPAALARFLRAYHVSYIVIDDTPQTSSPYPGELSQLGLHALTVGGVTLYHVAG